jgi:hypothetical protein
MCVFFFLFSSIFFRRNLKRGFGNAECGISKKRFSAKTRKFFPEKWNLFCVV